MIAQLTSHITSVGHGMSVLLTSSGSRIGPGRAPAEISPQFADIANSLQFLLFLFHFLFSLFLFVFFSFLFYLLNRLYNAIYITKINFFFFSFLLFPFFSFLVLSLLSFLFFLSFFKHSYLLNKQYNAT